MILNICMAILFFVLGAVAVIGYLRIQAKRWQEYHKEELIQLHEAIDQFKQEIETETETSKE